MAFAAITSLGVGLSMDAFAVAMGQGTVRQTPQQLRRQAWILAVLFGAAQAAMPLLGWTLGEVFQQGFRHIDHWVAFVLLAFLGGSMIYAACQQDDAPPKIASGWQLLTLAIATNIDAAAAGITLAMLGMPILLACAIIGCITFALTLVGTFLGRIASAKLGNIAECVGGLILIALGSKILVQHLFFG